VAITKIVLIGGTKRAVETFKAILELNNSDLQISLCIFMPGYQDELPFCSELEKIANDNSIEYISSNIIDEEIITHLKEISPHVILGLGIWRSMIADRVLEIPEFGYIGLHGTPLPRLRGFAGVYWQILNGYNEIKTRFYRLDPGVDSGPYVCDIKGNVLEYAISIDNEKHLDDILKDYDSMHIKANIDFIDKLVKREFSFKEQPEEEATYSCHRGPDDAEINWDKSTKEIFNFIRAQSTPCPGAYTYFNNKKVVIWRVKPRYDYSNYEGRIPGKIVSRFHDRGSVVILTADGGIEVIEAEIEDLCFERPFDIFNSVRKKCQNKIEAKLNSLLLMIKNA